VRERQHVARRGPVVGHGVGRRLIGQADALRQWIVAVGRDRRRAVFGGRGHAVQRVVGVIDKIAVGPGQPRAIAIGVEPEGAAHLRRVLLAYAAYYNSDRTHLSLGKDAPRPRAVESEGDIIALPILGGLHHRYGRNRSG